MDGRAVFVRRFRLGLPAPFPIASNRAQVGGLDDDRLEWPRETWRVRVLGPCYGEAAATGITTPLSGTSAESQLIDRCCESGRGDPTGWDARYKLEFILLHNIRLTGGTTPRIHGK